MLNGIMNNMDLTCRMIVVGRTDNFIGSVSDYLSKQGVTSEFFTDPVKSLTALQDSIVSLLIVEYNPDGCFNGDYLFKVHEQSDDLSIALVIPSMETQLRGDLFSLPIMECLVLPLDYERLMNLIRKACTYRQATVKIRECREQLENWVQELVNIELSLKSDSRLPAYIPVNSFLSITFRNILQLMMDIQQITLSFVNPGIEPEACHLFNCPRLLELTRSLMDTVDVLEKTKHAFKSRELGILRQRLEKVINGEKIEDSGKVDT